MLADVASSCWFVGDGGVRVRVVKLGKPKLGKGMVSHVR